MEGFALDLGGGLCQWASLFRRAASWLKFGWGWGRG
ncbi:MAG: hypothetical protein HPKKFMNG_00411 [Planctomycetes bacterium]|nr:hypothetical protein [Planctomycetota bacterium]